MSSTFGDYTTLSGHKINFVQIRKMFYKNEFNLIGVIIKNKN